MPFLKNAWYCAGWSHELDDAALLGRKLVGEHVMLYRKEDGTAIAVGDACPHRFAPMHKGKREGDVVECPYHGLKFGPDGECTENPYGDRIPKSCSLPSYRLEERWNTLWIWMGDPAKANPDDIPDFSMTMPTETTRTVYGHYETKAEYRLVVDNLLDRSHVQYLHPLLHQPNKPDNYAENHSTELDGTTVLDYHNQLNCPKFKLLNALWPEAPELTENYFDVRWSPPGNMLLNSGVTEMGSDRKVGSHTPMANLVTPADEETSHYFWNMNRDLNLDPDIDQKILMGVGHTFEHEDGAMVAACFERMGTADLMSLKPVMLPGDAASVRARMILDKLIAEETTA